MESLGLIECHLSYFSHWNYLPTGCTPSCGTRKPNYLSPDHRQLHHNRGPVNHCPKIENRLESRLSNPGLRQSCWPGHQSRDCIHDAGSWTWLHLKQLNIWNRRLVCVHIGKWDTQSPPIFPLATTQNSLMTKSFSSADVIDTRWPPLPTHNASASWADIIDSSSNRWKRQCFLFFRPRSRASKEPSCQCLFSIFNDMSGWNRSL